jgi:hypothetical protein
LLAGDADIAGEADRFTVLADDGLRLYPGLIDVEILGFGKQEGGHPAQAPVFRGVGRKRARRSERKCERKVSEAQQDDPANKLILSHYRLLVNPG